jgi:hypothetical protein
VYLIYAQQHINTSGWLAGVFYIEENDFRILFYFSPSLFAIPFEVELPVCFPGKSTMSESKPRPP